MISQPPEMKLGLRLCIYLTILLITNCAISAGNQILLPTMTSCAQLLLKKGFTEFSEQPFSEQWAEDFLKELLQSNVPNGWIVVYPETNTRKTRIFRAPFPKDRVPPDVVYILSTRLSTIFKVGADYSEAIHKAILERNPDSDALNPPILHIKWSKEGKHWNLDEHLDATAFSLTWSNNQGTVVILDRGQEYIVPSFKVSAIVGEKFPFMEPEAQNHRSPTSNLRPRLFIQWLY